MTSSSKSAQLDSPTRDDPRWSAAVFVWATWILMLGAAFWFAWAYGSKYPYFDDFGMVHWLTGDTPATWAVFWEQYNDHRIPLPRVFWLILYRAFGGDFHAGMYLNIALIGALAAALIYAAKRIRGRSEDSDAFFPILLLTWQGKLSLFLWTFILQMALSTALAGAVLAIMASARTSLSPGKLILAGVCIVLMPLCGANGLAIALVLAFWLLFVGLFELIAYRRAVSAVISCTFSLLTFGVIALYYVGFDRTITTSPELGPAEMIRRLPTWNTGKSVVMFLAMGLGMSGQAVYGWLVNGIHLGLSNVGLASWADARWPYATIGIFAFIFLVVVPLTRTWFTRPTERFRVSNLAFFFAACACLTLAIGIGRGGEGVFDQYRYIVLVAPMFATVYLIWVLANGAVSRVLQKSMFAIATVLVIPNSEIALRSAKDDREAVRAFERDLLAGVPSIELTERHAQPFLLANAQENREAFIGYLRLMQKYGDKHYSALTHADVPLNERLDATAPTIPGLLMHDGWYGPAHGGRWSKLNGVVTFCLPHELRVQPLRLRMMANTFGPEPIVLTFNGKRLGNIQADDREPKIFEFDLPPSTSLEIPPEPGQLREYNILTFDRGLGVAWFEFVTSPHSP
jgi:hypothetical protein